MHVPVLVAAAASVPAVFLVRLDGPVSLVGSVLNWASMLVLTAESVLLFWSSGDRLRWLRDHWWMALVTVVTVPAVIFAIGPAQVLRLIRVVAAIQLLRVFRLVKVAHVVHRRSWTLGRLRYILGAGVLVLAAVLTGFVLTDEDSATRQTVEAVVERWGWTPLVGAVLLVLASLGSLVTWIRRRDTTS